MNHRLPILLVGLFVLAAACASGGSDPGRAKADYTPVADDELFARIAKVPGVEGVDIRYNGTFPESKYGGRITIETGADAQDVLDASYAILRMGRFDVAISVYGVQDNTQVTFEGLGGRSGIPSELTKRYGSQPGDGTPPAR